MNQFLSWKAEVIGPTWLNGVLPDLQRRAGICPLPVGAVSASSGEREAVGKRMGINKINTEEREILYVNTHCPPSERERNMLGCLLPFQKHIEMKVHKLFKKNNTCQSEGEEEEEGRKEKDINWRESGKYFD